MKIKDINDKFIGNWEGKYCLILSWLPNPDFISISKMTIKSIANGKFLLFTYDWQHEDQTQDGLILIGNDNELTEVTASWVDSWGMGGKIMNCNGTINVYGDIILLGSYEVDQSPNWNWRIEIPCPKENHIQIKMFNISPTREEFPASDANYNRI